MSKVESGKMDVHVGQLGLAVIADYVERTFRTFADAKKLEFEMEVADDRHASITTHEHRLQQIISNLLSNAFKFTEKGKVAMRIGAAPEEHVFANDALVSVKGLLAISVSDTGIGIFFFSSRRRHTRCSRDWSSDVCSSDLIGEAWDSRQEGRDDSAGHRIEGSGFQCFGFRSQQPDDVQKQAEKEQPDGEVRSEERRVGKECRTRWSP